MREIKFRAWEEARLMNGKVRRRMISNEELLCYAEIPSPMLSSGFHDATPDGDVWVWLQYTGLKDKNGVEIYEGDVLRDGKDATLIGVVFWNDMRAMFGIDPSQCDATARSSKFIAPFDDWSDWEVIGNIYQNPELVK